MACEVHAEMDLHLLFKLAGGAVQDDAADQAACQEGFAVSGATHVAAACAPGLALLDIGPGDAAARARRDAACKVCRRLHPRAQEEQGSNQDGDLESGGHLVDDVYEQGS